MSNVNSSTYISILGSCCTADAFRGDGWAAFADAGLRVHAYEGRTGIISLLTPGLREEEFEHTARFRPDVARSWGYRMARDELLKNHLARLERNLETADALIVDVVAMFNFAHLFLRGDARVFLESWECGMYFRVKPAADRLWLWEIPYELSRDGVRRCLALLLARRPGLRVIFHVPPVCLNDGVRFKEWRLNERVDFYYGYSERLAEDAVRGVPHGVVLQPPRTVWAADPSHPYGRHPFHYRADYYAAFRRLVKEYLSPAARPALAETDGGPAQTSGLAKSPSP
jgi:hypothetical protein